MRRRARTAIVLLIAVSKLIGGMLLGFSPLAAAAEGSEHHCETMAMNLSSIEQSSDIDSSEHQHGKRTNHDGHCSNGCQCGCTHAPGSLFVPANCDLVAGQAPAAHTAEPLAVRARPDSVFKPPI